MSSPKFRLEVVALFSETPEVSKVGFEADSLGLELLVLLLKLIGEVRLLGTSTMLCLAKLS